MTTRRTKPAPLTSPATYETTVWRRRAACLDADPELFFPTGEGSPAEMQVADAKAICFRCPVINQCAQWALDNRQEHGVWGGYDPAERRRILRHARALKKEAS